MRTVASRSAATYFISASMSEVRWNRERKGNECVLLSALTRYSSSEEEGIGIKSANSPVCRLYLTLGELRRSYVSRAELPIPGWTSLRDHLYTLKSQLYITWIVNWGETLTHFDPVSLAKKTATERDDTCRSHWAHACRFGTTTDMAADSEIRGV